MPTFASPLRYPGGKEVLGRLLGRIIELNGLQDGIYAEPYAGGAGAALYLLYGEYVSQILINDLDVRIFAFWRSVIDRTDQFLNLIDTTPVTIDEWHRQRAIYLRPGRASRIRLGFAAYFLNRCNRSGIMVDGGPIGGIAQLGKWKIDARYYRETMRARIEKIAQYRERITVTNHDALDFLRKVVSPLPEFHRVLTYLDPPYYSKGKKLYFNAYEDTDHERVAEFLSMPQDFRWIMSYDDVPAIRRLYVGCQQKRFALKYTAYERRSGRELLISPPELSIPRQIKPWVASRKAS